MRTIEPQPLAAGISALLLIASAAWWGLSAPTLVDPGQPTWKGADIVRLRAAVPEIAEFKEFYTNDQNPFVPFADRELENRRLDPNRPQHTPPPRPERTAPPMKPPVEIVERPRPELVLPKLSPAPANAPLAYGLVVVEGKEAVVVRMSDVEQAVTMQPGDKIGGWTLVAIDNGNLATFLDPLGAEQRFAIGQGDLASSQGEGAPAPGKEAVGKEAAGKGGAPGRAPRPAGMGGTGRPGSTGAEGAVPRPPVREERPRKQPPRDEAGKPVPPAK